MPLFVDFLILGSPVTIYHGKGTLLWGWLLYTGTLNLGTFPLYIRTALSRDCDRGGGGVGTVIPIEDRSYKYKGDIPRRKLEPKKCGKQVTAGLPRIIFFRPEMRSPRTVQQMQPLFISMTFSCCLLKNPPQPKKKLSMLPYKGNMGIMTFDLQNILP